MKKLIAILAFLFAAPVFADPVIFTVLHPTQFDDNAPITVQVRTPIDCGPTNVAGDFANGWNFVTQVNTPATDSAAVEFPVGVWYCAAHSAIVGGNLSPYSAVITFEIKAKPASTTTKPPVLKVKVG